MRIIVSTHDWLSPIYGGGALRTVLVAKELKKRGHDVIIIGPSKTDRIDGIKIISVPAPRKVRSQILSAIKFNFRLFFRFLKYIRNCDLIFLHNTIAAPAPLFLSKVFRRKIIFDISDIHAEYLKVGKINFLEKIAMPFLLWIEYLMINLADKIVLVTKTMKQHIINMGVDEKKVTVVYDGAYVNNTFEKGDEFYFNVIHLGTIDKQHGVDILVKSIPYVVKSVESARFIFVGGGRELENIKKLAENLKIEKHCIFTGYIPFEQTRKYLNKSNIGVIPRSDSLPNHLVVTLKLLEYWANGVVVVTSKLSGICEIAEDGKTAVFFKPGDEKDLASKLVDLLTNQEKTEAIRRKSFEVVKKFSWEKLIPELVDFVEYG